MYRLYRSSMERYTDLQINELETCLSKKVHYILCDAAVKECDGRLAPVNEAEGVLDWPVIQRCLPAYTADSYEYFVDCATSLSPVFKASHEYLMALTPEQFHTKYSKWLTWTSMPKALQHCFELVKNDDGLAENSTRPIESLLLSTTILERSLGDVFLLKGRQCPSMLKDLLVTRELKAIFGETVIQVLRVVMGPSISLNLRNVAWHGFPRSGELTPRYAMFMLHLIISLGHVLHDKGVSPKSIRHRSLLTFPQVHQLPFARCELEAASHPAVIHLFQESSLVLKPMLPFWCRALELYFKERYDECVVLLLPQLEHALRRVFAAANNCPERVLTAENNVLYTTFDEILHHKMEDGSLNKLRDYVGEAYVTMLLDVLMFPEGPRVRDRLSHGECALLWTVCEETETDSFQSLKKQWHLLANHIISVIIAYCLLFLPDDQLTESNEAFKRIATEAPQYRSVFHPVALLQSELSETANLLLKWKDIPRPSKEEMEMCDAWSSESAPLPTSDSDPALICAKSYIYNSSSYMTGNNLKTFLEPFSSVEGLTCQHAGVLDTLYRYKSDAEGASSRHEGEQIANAESNKEEEIVGLLRRILSQIREICGQVSASCALRYQQWVEKKLRSRQRNTYQRMLNTLPVLSTGLRVILILNLSFLQKMADPSKWNTSEQLKDIKLLKLVLQYTENLTTFTCVDKNRWEEAEKITLQLYVKCSNAPVK